MDIIDERENKMLYFKDVRSGECFKLLKNSEGIFMRIENEDDERIPNAILLNIGAYEWFDPYDKIGEIVRVDLHIVG